MDLTERRESLLAAYNCDLYKDTEQECGIGGGYGQFGILTEKEFNTVLKTDSKRIKKFTEHPDQFKE